MNHVVMIGRLTKEPDVRRSQNKDTAIASFNLAVERRYKREGDPTADFFNCTCFGKLAEFCEKYLSKGTKIAVEGHLQNDSYEKDGQQRMITKIMVDFIEFAGSKSDGQKESAASQSESKGRSKKQQPEPQIEDEIPFY